MRKEERNGASPEGSYAASTDSAFLPVRGVLYQRLISGIANLERETTVHEEVPAVYGFRILMDRHAYYSTACGNCGRFESDRRRSAADALLAEFIQYRIDVVDVINLLIQQITDDYIVFDGVRQ